MKIRRLKLLSSNFEEQLKFYTETLGLKLIEQNNSIFTIEIGNSELTFQKSINFFPYHFAINIPSNAEQEALDFVKTRKEVLKHDNAEIIDYKNWNAKAIYFYDMDKNLVELISRNNLNYPHNKLFDRTSFIEISEIGLATTNIEEVYKKLNSSCGLKIYDGSFDRFCAIGDETGLFICIDKDLKNWFPTNDKAFSSHFELLMEEKEKRFELTFNGELFIRELDI